MSKARFAVSPLALFCAVAVLVACSADRKLPTDGGGEPPPDPSATFTRVQSEIFTARCAFSGCHGDSAPQQGMILSAGSAYGNIVGIQAHESSKLRIHPGDPDGSYLINKIRGDIGITSSRMPDGGPYLSDAEIKLVVDWVRRGAPND